MKSRKTFRMTPVKASLLGVVLVTIVTILIFPIARLSFDVNTSKGLQHIGYYGILATMITLMGSLIHARVNTPVLAKIVVDRDRVGIAPCDCEQVWIVSKALSQSPLKKRMESLRNQQAQKIQVVVMRGLEIDNGFEQIWADIPNMQILDLQHASVPDSFWSSLEGCPELKHVLIHGLEYSTPLREVAITLPEIRLHERPMLIVAQGTPFEQYL